MNLRILFVEDSVDDAELMLRRLREAGIEAQWHRVQSEDALREALAGERWDLALVDYNLPGFGGLEALAVLAAEAPDVPAVTVSGAISEETAVATITAGAVDYVLKDNLTRLAPAARRAVEGAELRRRHRRSAEAARLALFAVDHASMSIMTVAADGMIIYVNNFACDELGACREEIVGAKVWEYDQNASAATWPVRWEALEQSRVMEFEVDRVRRDGRRRVFDVTANYLDGANCLISYGRDITDKRMAEDRAAESEALYRRIVELATDGIWAFDSAHRLTFANPQMAHVLGYEPDEMVGRVYTDFVFEEDLAEHATQAVAREQGAPGQYESRFRARDGSEVWLAVSAVADLDPEGGYTGSFAMCTDVTERRRAEVALRESEERHRAMFEKNRAIKLVVDLETAAIVDANPAACEFYGYSLDELRARKLTDISTSSAAEVSEAMGRIAREQVTDFVFEHRLASGELRDVEVNSGPFEIAGRTLLFSVIHDVTDRRRAEDALRESEERFEEFAAHFPGYLFMQDEERRYVYVNRREHTDGDVARDEWLGKTPSQVWEGGDALRAEIRVQRALDGEVIDVVEPWVPPGLSEYLHTIYFPIPRAGRPPLVGGISVDVTGQVEAEEEVRRQAEQLRRTVEGTVLAMSNVVETRDPYTAGHERRVAELAAAIAGEMGMEGDGREALRVAGLIHDIGKIAVPAEILSTPGLLSAAELNLLKQHPACGFDILAVIDFGRPVAEMVLQHHERLDGSGYPRGLGGEEILPEARILAVADVVEAMSSHRPYRAALGMEAALAEIRAHAGVKYDADVVAACVRLVEEQSFAFTP